MGRQGKQERLYLTISKEKKLLLEQWADQQGRHITNLATWIVERALKDAIASGELKPAQSSNTDSLAISYIQALSNSGTMSVLDLQRLADGLSIDSERLAEILKQSQGKINGNNHQDRISK